MRSAHLPGVAPFLGLAQQCEVALSPNLCGVDLVHLSCLLRSCSNLAFASIVPRRDGHTGRRAIFRLGL
jgi:hypothetical protein